MARYHETPDVDRERMPSVQGHAPAPAQFTASRSNDVTALTPLEAQVKLYKAQLYCMMMAGKQRTDENRRGYNTAVNLLRDLQRDILADLNN